MPFAEESEIPKPRANPNEKINETQLIASIIQEQQQAEAIAGFKAQRYPPSLVRNNLGATGPYLVNIINN